jgi:two-component system, chemotaxis family, response regulator Rcp1
VPCIFLAEDNPGDVDLLRVALEEHSVDCELLVAADGEKALRFLEDIGAGTLGCPALAILDLNLPKKTGREVLQRMRENPAWKSVPVVILSSSDSEKDRAETAELGASRYIRKPSSLDAFVQIGGVLKDLLVPGA